MAYTAQVLVDQTSVDAARDVLSPAKVRAILRSAVGEEARRFRTQASRAVREELNLSKAAVDKTISVRVDGDGAEVRVDRVAVPLKEYNPRQTKAGLLVKVRKNAPAELLKGAFLVAKLGDHAFERGSRKVPPRPMRRVRKRGPSGKVISSALPIEKKFGPTVEGVLAGKPGMLDALVEDATKHLNERIKSKIGFALEGGKIGNE
jgi:hypothetical protein